MTELIGLTVKKGLSFPYNLYCIPTSSFDCFGLAGVNSDPGRFPPPGLVTVLPPHHAMQIDTKNSFEVATLLG